MASTVTLVLALLGLLVSAALTFAVGNLLEEFVGQVPRLAAFDWPLWAHTLNNVTISVSIGSVLKTMVIGAVIYVGAKLFKTLRPQSTKSAKKRRECSSRSAYRSRTYPYPYPNGWYTLLLSSELPVGAVKAVDALGLNFAVFRGESGVVGVVHAYCPHMGADLTINGTVCGDNVRCPFHHWKFDTTGQCVEIEYTDKTIPRNANIKAYHAREYHGMICVWYHAEGNDPDYELPIQADIADGSLVYRGEFDAGLINMHLQEMAENAGDSVHFDIIHDSMMIPFTRLNIPFIGKWFHIKHNPKPVLGDEEEAAKYGVVDKHFLYFLDFAVVQFCGKDIESTRALAAVTFCGPCGINAFRISFPDWGDIVLFHTHLPEQAVEQHVKFLWYASPKLPRVLVWTIVGVWISQWTNDLDIWENKMFPNKPVVVSGDGPIQKVRRWYKQFYCDPEVYRAKRDGMDW